MAKRIIIRNGKKYFVNVPDWDNHPAGWEDGIGSGGPQGTLWMMSTDNNWYPINVSGSAGVVALYVSQSALTWQSPGQDVGNQLLACDNGNSYVVYLSGTPPAVTFTVNQTPFTGSAYPKPDLLLKSITNGNFYMVTLHNNSGTIQPLVNQTYISASMIQDI